MTYYLIWKDSSLEANLEAFNKLNNLQELPLTPRLQEWAIKFQLNYPNSSGTSRWSDPIICTNQNSIYYNSVAMPISDAIYKNLNEYVLRDLILLGVPLPDEGIDTPITKLPYI